MARAFHRLVFSRALIQTHIPVSSVRLYARWVSRNPAKVLLPFESKTKSSLKKEKVISLDPDIINKSKDKTEDHIPLEENADLRTKKTENATFPPEKVKKIKDKRNEELKKREFYLSQKKVFDDNNEVMYEKLKEKDSRISSLLVKLKSKKDRLRTGQVLVEGWRLIADGLEAKCKLKYVLFSRTEDLNNIRPFLPNTGVVLYKMPYKEMQLWSDVETTPGIFGIFQMPEPENVKRLCKPLPIHFVCDNIRVPGNLGAILRVAVGAGCEKVLLTKGCVDLWDSKVIRSAAGAHFRLPIYNSIEWEEIDQHLDKESSIFIADSNTDDFADEDTDKSNSVSSHITVLPYYGVQFSSFKHITLIIGGETEGISEESYSLAAQQKGLRLNIPLEKGVDSLNTGMATAVIAFEIRRQLIEALRKARIDKQSVQAT